MMFFVRRKQGGEGRTAGFSVLELLVAITIITLTSAMTLVSFTGVRDRTAVNRAARDLALAARRVQQLSLSVSAFEAGFSSPTAQMVGISVVSDSSEYTIFLDKNENGIYETGVDTTSTQPGLSGEFVGGVRIRRIGYIDLIGNPASTLVAHVIFAAPEATMRFTDVSGNNLGEVLDIEIGTTAGIFIRTVTIRISGQISIK